MDQKRALYKKQAADGTTRGEKREKEKERRNVILPLLALLILFIAFFSSLYAQKQARRKGIAYQPTLLVTMVQNEKDNLPVLLNSALDNVATAFLICDTGSIDGTKDVVRTMLLNQEYELVDVPWVDFATSRNQCMKRAAKLIRYRWPETEWVLFLDADQEVKRTNRNLPQHGVNLVSIFEQDGSQNQLPYLVHTSLLVHSCQYRCVTHEYLYCDKDATTMGHYDGIRIWHHRAGKDKTTFLRDIRMIETALKNETDPCPASRYHFYLAQSFDNTGEYQKAITHYNHRLQYNGWYQEKWYALYRKAVASFVLGKEEAIALFLQAHNTRGGVYRKEPLYYLAHHYRLQKNYTRCLLYSTAGLYAPPVPVNEIPLFIDPILTGWALKDEHALCLYYMGYVQEAGQWWRNALAMGSSSLMTEKDVARVTQSLSFVN